MTMYLDQMDTKLSTLDLYWQSNSQLGLEDIVP